MNRRGSGSGVHSLDRDVDSAEFRECWVRRDTTCDQAALLLATSQSRPGTFVLVFGPEPSFMSALLVTSTGAVRPVAISRRLPRGLSAYHPLTGEVVEFMTVREFIERHRSVFRYNYAPPPRVPLVLLDLGWNKSFRLLHTDTDNDKCTFSEASFASHVHAIASTTYPVESQGGWSIMCDAAAALVFPSRTHLVLCDGCGWGQASRAAAIAGIHAWVSYVASFQFCCKDTDALARGYLSGVNVVHERVCASSPDSLSANAGNTTLLAASVVRLRATEPDQWGLVVVSVGDVKCFVLGVDGAVREVTLGNRGNTTDATDCGGRLGPQIKSTLPDLRNLRCYYEPLHAGEVVLAMSDGVHDNFDPEYCAAKGVCDDWTALDATQAVALKSKWACESMAALLGALGTRDVGRLCACLIEHCATVTQPSRKFMADFPHKKLPTDYALYPGKMDHSTVVACVVGEVQLPDDVVHDVATFRPSVLALSNPDEARTPSSPRARLEAIAQDPALTERVVEFVTLLNNPQSLKMLQFALAVVAYIACPVHDRRARALAIASDYLYDNSPLCEGEMGLLAKACVRKIKATGPAAISLRRAQPQDVFDRLMARVMPTVERLLVSYSDHVTGRALYQPTASTAPTPAEPPEPRRRKGSRESAQITLEALLASPMCKNRVLAFGTQHGHEVPLRYHSLCQEYRREVHDVSRRELLAQQLWDHFLSPLSPSPITVTLEARRRVRAALDNGSYDLALFAETAAQVEAHLTDELFPLCLANTELCLEFARALARERLNAQFLAAMMNGDERTGLACLEDGADINVVDAQGYNALLSTAWRGDYRLCMELLKRGAYVNQVTHDNSTVWHVLAAGPQGEVPFVWTPDLRTFCRKLSDVAIVTPLSVNSFNTHAGRQETALHVAVLANAPIKFVQYLVERCGDYGIVEARNASGETALHYASRMDNPTLHGWLTGQAGAQVRRNSVAAWVPRLNSDRASGDDPDSSPDAPPKALSPVQARRPPSGNG